MSKKLPISMCLICRNEEMQLEQSILSYKDYISQLIIIDTGSTDNSQNIAKKYADHFEVFTDCNDENNLICDFAMARNKAFSYANQPFVMWSDLDDIIQHPEELINITDKFKDINQDLVILLPYIYSIDDKGNPSMIHYRERIVKSANGKNILDKFKWLGNVHETLNPIDGLNNLLTVQLEKPLYIHNRKNKVVSEPGRNLRILRKYFEKNPNSEDWRQYYYYGLELKNNNLIDDSNKYFIKYISMSGWNDEKALALLSLSDNYYLQNKFDESISAALEASVIKPWGEPYFNIARAFYSKAQQGGINEMENWSKCAHFAKLGLLQEPTKTVLFVSPLYRSVEIYRYLNMALQKIGDVEGALRSVEEGLKTYPDDQQFLNNRMFYIKHLSRIKINQEMGKMIQANALDQKTYDEVMRVFDCNSAAMVPAAPVVDNSKNDQVWEIVKNSKKELSDCYWDDGKIVKKFAKRKVGNRGKNALDVVVFVGNGLRPCNPKMALKAGGSEWIEQEISKRLAQKYGHRVRLYNNPGETEGLYNGVEYIKTEKFYNLDCDVAIISRFANMLDDNYKINTKLKLLHCHDLVAINGQHSNLLNADRILALSKFHKQYLKDAHNLHDSHLFQTRNGIDISLFQNKNIKRDPFKIIGASSPDRYLISFLNMYPIIKKREPRTSAVICYGMENWRQIAQANNDVKQLETIKMLEDKMKELEPQGLTFKGKLTQEELANEMLSSSVGILSNWFFETSCLIAMQNCAAGVKMVSSRNGALPETNINGVLIDGDWLSHQYQNNFIDAVCKSFHTSEKERQRMMQYATDNFDIDSLVDEWNEMFYNLIEDKKTNPIIPYNPTREFK